MAMNSRAFDWKEYIGYFVASFVVCCYGCIFWFIWRDGEWEREVERRANDPANLPRMKRIVKESSKKTKKKRSVKTKETKITKKGKIKSH